MPELLLRTPDVVPAGYRVVPAAIESARAPRTGQAGDPTPRRQLHIPARSPDGFAISLTRHDRGLVLALGGLELDVAEVDEAMPWIKAALSPSYRLRVDVLDEIPRRWTLQRQMTSGRWEDQLASGVGLTDRVCARSLFLQNRALPGT